MDGGFFVIGVIACFLALIWMLFHGHFDNHNDRNK